jgi:manganese/iron transport system ATP-binding protein
MFGPLLKDYEKEMLNKLLDSTAERVHQPATERVDQETPPALAVTNLSVRYNGVVVLHDVTMSVKRGERIAIVGPNGAGKSTFMRAIVGLLPGVSGEVRLDGLGRAPEIGYLTQRSSVDWAFPVTVFDVVMMGRIGKIGWLRWYRRRDRRIVQDSLQRVGMLEYAERQIGELSGGQQQRVFIARALAQEANLLLMDEPFTGVDLPSQDTIMAILDELRAQHITVLVSTHDLTLAVTRFDRVALLNRRLISYGPADLAINSENLVNAYGGQAVRQGNDFVMVVDQLSCCGHEDDHG